MKRVRGFFGFSMPGVFGLGVRAGVVLPVAYYAGRVWFWHSFPWDLPAHSGVRQAVAAAIWASLIGAFVWREKWPAGRGRFWAGRCDWRTIVAGVRRRRIWFQAGLLLVVGLVCWRHGYTYVSALPGERYETGDERYWLENASNPRLMTSEPLGRWTQYAAYRVLRAAWAAEDEEALADGALRLASIGAGLFLLAMLLARARGAAPGAFDGWGTLLLWLSPAALVYTGYPETTPWCYAFTTLYCVDGVRYLQGPGARPPWRASAWLMLAIGTHGVACFLAAAHVALIVHCRRSQRRQGSGGDWAAIARLAAAAALPLCLLGGLGLLAGAGALPEALKPLGDHWYGNMLGGADGHRWVSFEDPPFHRSQYVFMKWRHLTDLTNLFLMGNPMVILAPFALRQLGADRRREAVFLGLALAGLIGFAITWNADWGLRRDFDLFALFAVPTQVLMVCWWFERLEAGRRAELAILTTLTTFVWMLLPYLG